MTESPEEKEALEKLDETTRDVAWQEEQKEADRELSTMTIVGPRIGPIGWLFGRFRLFGRTKGDPVAEPVDHDEDPVDHRGLKDVLDDDPKTEG